MKEQEEIIQIDLEDDQTRQNVIKIIHKNKRIKIFGASKLGQEAYQDLASYADVVGFIDNSEDKMGRFFLDKMTELPSKDIANDCDLILIASLFAPDIYQQLLQLDIPKEKIKCYKLIDSQIPFLNFFQAPITEYQNYNEITQNPQNSTSWIQQRTLKIHPKYPQF